MTRRLVQAGDVAEVELAAAEAECERRRDDLYSSVGRLSAVENRLKTLLAGDVTDPVWSEQIIPVETTRSSEISETADLFELVQRALKHRTEFRQLDHKSDIVAAQKQLAADGTRPQVDVIAGYVTTGLAGSTRAVSDPFTASSAALYQQVNALSQRAGLQPIAPPAAIGIAPDLTGNFGSTLSSLFGGRYQTFQVGLNIDLNLRNRTAAAHHSRALIEEKRQALERKKLAQTVLQQVRDAVQEIDTARQRVAAAQASTRAAQERLDSETRLYQTGESTNFLVLTRQNEYSDSRTRLIAANVDLNRARARLEQTVGATLRNYAIQMHP
jgi:outer membrane protein TolC